MNLIKKLVIGATGATIALSTMVTPAFAATAYNKNVNKSFARAVAIENTTNVVSITNASTFVVSGNVVLAGSGGNLQLGNRDGNKMLVGGSSAVGSTSTSVNTTTVVF